MNSGGEKSMLSEYLKRTIFQKYENASFDVQMLRLAKNMDTRKIIASGVRQTLQEAAEFERRLKLFREI
jgi:hypothetical protein